MQYANRYDKGIHKIKVYLVMGKKCCHKHDTE